METADSATPDGPLWRTASMCNGGDCVRIASRGQTVLLGDSKFPDGPVLTYTQPEWNEFIARVKRGAYDSY